MSDQIKHECGIVLIRLLKPLEYYHKKYGSWMYGLNKLYLLMEKQHNRGQDGAGVVTLKLDQPSGTKYLFRKRSNKENPIQDVFSHISDIIMKEGEGHPDMYSDPQYAKDELPFVGELYLGHLRYGTFGRHSLDYVHPVMRENNWRSRNLVLAGNFNLTNVDEIFQSLEDLGSIRKIIPIP